MLREVVSGIGLSFFPVAALLLFVAVYVSVVGRAFMGRDKGHWRALSSMAIEDSDSACEEGTR